MMNRQKYFSFLKNISPLGLFVSVILFASEVFAIPIFINEIHYDNTGTDQNEGVEISGPAGVDLAGWRIAFYNGSNGKRYNTYLNINGIIPDQSDGFGTLAFLKPGLQNDMEGIALLDGSDTVIQFLSYEGIFTAVNGPAAGITSTDIGVFESSSTALGNSLQLTGTGNSYADFSWATAGPSSFGNINTGQSFSSAAVVPEPDIVVLMGIGLAGLFFFPRVNREVILRRL